MERRRRARIPLILKAKIIIGDKIYNGFTESISIDGIKSVITSFLQTSEDFTLSEIIRLNFQIPSGETIHLDCRLIWFSKISSEDAEVNLGLKIIDPPAAYHEFATNLVSEAAPE